jgi:2-keto-4-pentenoate hydratase
MKYILLLAMTLVNIAFITKNPALSAPKNGYSINREIAQDIAKDYLDKIPISLDIQSLSLEQALKIQQDFVRLLIPHLGKSVGYKVALTNPSIQKRFNTNSPLYGIILEKMLLNNNGDVPANFGISPRLEGDLMVRVGSEKINRANTPEEILACLDAVIPYLELPDLAYGENINLNAPSLAVINAGARLGVKGEEIPLIATPEWQEKLGEIQVVITNEMGQELARGDSSALLGHPLKVVIWLRDKLRAEGKYLRKGDLISLGSMTALLPVGSGGKIKAQYFGLKEEAIEININFN